MATLHTWRNENKFLNLLRADLRSYGALGLLSRWGPGKVILTTSESRSVAVHAAYSTAQKPYPEERLGGLPTWR